LKTSTIFDFNHLIEIKGGYLTEVSLQKYYQPESMFTSEPGHNILNAGVTSPQQRVHLNPKKEAA